MNSTRLARATANLKALSTADLTTNELAGLIQAFSANEARATAAVAFIALRQADVGLAAHIESLAEVIDILTASDEDPDTTTETAE